MIKPNLFIPGFAKAGTTALVSYLSQHKDIFVSWRKEPHTLYLYKSFPSWNSKGRFEDYILDYNSYLQLYSNAKDYRYRVDGSVTYTMYPENAYKIKELNSDAKVIICIREQKSRLVSTYLYTYTHHKVSNFNYWMDKYFINEIDTFLFYDKVKTYYNVFGDNLRIIDNNDLKNEPQYIMDLIFNFLNLEPIKVDIVYRNPTIVTPYDNILYKYSMFAAREILVRVLYIMRALNCEYAFWAIINAIRYNIGKGFIEKKAKASNNKLFIDMVPQNIKDILDRDYNTTLQFARDNNILLETKNKITYKRY